MKRSKGMGLFLSVCLLGTCFLSSCGDPDQPIGDMKCEVILPEGLIVTPEVPAAVSVYSARRLCIQDLDLPGELLHGETEDEQVWATSVEFRSTWEESNSREVLVVYDNGMAFGSQPVTASTGSFSYSLWDGENAKAVPYENVFSIGALGQSGKGQDPWNQNGDFTQTDLDFLPLQEAQQSVISRFAGWDVTLIPHDSLALDVDTLNEHQPLFRQEQLAINSAEYEEKVWQKEEEAYALRFRQVVNGIPVVDRTGWIPLSASGRSTSYHTEVTALADRQGMFSLDAVSLLQVGEEVTEGSVLSAQEAYSCLVQYCEQNRMSTDRWSVLQGELMYAPLFCGDEVTEELELVPVWLFTMQENYVFTDETTGETRKVTDISYLAFGASSGEILTTAFQGV